MSNDAHLVTLLKFLHYLANGEIPIKRKNFELIQEKNRLKLIKNTLESKKALNSLILKDRSEKLVFLNKLTEIFEPLLYPLFNEI
jgi:hypothetical protein